MRHYSQVHKTIIRTSLLATLGGWLILGGAAHASAALVDYNFVISGTETANASTSPFLFNFLVDDFNTSATPVNELIAFQPSPSSSPALGFSPFGPNAGTFTSTQAGNVFTFQDTLTVALIPTDPYLFGFVVGGNTLASPTVFPTAIQVDATTVAGAFLPVLPGFESGFVSAELVDPGSVSFAANPAGAPELDTPGAGLALALLGGGLLLLADRRRQVLAAQTAGSTPPPAA